MRLVLAHCILITKLSIRTATVPAGGLQNGQKERLPSVAINKLLQPIYSVFNRLDLKTQKRTNPLILGAFIVVLNDF
jgi:hypothetical protein